MTNVTYIGNLTSDPELRFTPSGVAVANFNIAVNTRSKKGEEYVDDPTLFIRVNVWKDPAENVAESLEKGSRVIVTGRQKQTEFTDRDGNTRQQLEVTADEVGPSLRWAKGKVQKVQRSQGGGFAQSAPRPSPQGEQFNPQYAPQPNAQPAADPWAGGGNQGGYDDPPF